MILALFLILLKYLDETNGDDTVVITECHNGGSTEQNVPMDQIPRRPLPSVLACRDNGQNGLCNALFPINDALADNANL